MSAVWDKLRALLRPRLALTALLALAAALLVLLLGADGGEGMTGEERRVARTLSEIAGAGRVRVTIYYAPGSSAFGGGGGAPVGAVAVAQGADDIGVRLDIAAALQALLSLPPEGVMVFDREDSP